MNPIQIESWSLRVIDAVRAGQPNEDFLVELKREWPAPQKAARRIAGHANAVRGEKILWLIGVDEKAKKIHGASGDVDLADWYPKLEKHFVGFAPRLTPLNIKVDDALVVALLFETDQYPFVVKNPSGGHIQYEVPWRENTSIRSARREDLIRLISPLVNQPKIEIRSGIFQIIEVSQSIPSPDKEVSNMDFYLDLDFYIISNPKLTITFPFYRCDLKLYLPTSGLLETFSLEIRSLKPKGRTDRNNTHASGIMASRLSGSTFESLSPTIQWSPDQIILNGSGMLSIKAYKRFSLKSDDLLSKSKLEETDEDVLIRLEMNSFDLESSLIIETAMEKTEAERGCFASWEIKQ